MDNNIDKLKSLIEQLKNISFFKRLFGWAGIRNLLVDASADLQKLVSGNESLRNDNQKLESALSLSAKDVENITTRNTELSSDIAKLSQLPHVVERTSKQVATLEEANRNLQETLSGVKIELAAAKEKLASTQQELKKTFERNTVLEKEEEFRKNEYLKSVGSLNSTIEYHQQERAREVEALNNEEISRLKKLKETWFNHEENVQSRIKTICSKHTIEYVEKVPFKGTPDNTLKICDEFVIFDSKSPAGEDLGNFSAYIKDQAEKAKKYAKQENVKTDIFFVVPSNTLEILPQFVFSLSDYNLYIISIDALEPVILGLKKIEGYEFAEQLSPEERENICRILGKFTHMTKRRIQIDNYFATQFIELGYKCEADLPKEIFDEVLKYETQDKLNPPIEKRAKVINLKALDSETQKIKNDIGTKGIDTEGEKILKTMNEIPLYKNE